MTDLSLNAQFRAARDLAETNSWHQALAKCRRILRTFPKHVRTYGVLGYVYLQLGLYDAAMDLFQRVLSADPENALAYASLGTVYHERGLLDEAIWQMERAWEVAPANPEVRAELRSLYRERGYEAGLRLKPTRASLARTLMRGYLYSRAAGELRALLREQPFRQDLKVMLAEALWQENRTAEAAAVCQSILAELPNCLKANLILGRVWLESERDEEARALLQRAQALDPENIVAQELFGARSPLPPRVIRLPFEEQDAPSLDLPYLQPEEPEPASASDAALSVEQA